MTHEGTAMKIDGNQLTDDLLQRMQEAVEQQKTKEIDGTPGAEKASFRLDELQPPQQVDATEASQASPLQTRVRETAARALRGEFSDSESIRGAVVEDIVRDRWEPRLGRAEARKIVKSMKETLSGDPEFARQVDEMLILAARELGSRGSR